MKAVTNEKNKAQWIAVDWLGVQALSDAPLLRPLLKENAMAKGQQRGNKEPKKPKQPKKIPPPMTPGLPLSGIRKK